VLDIDDRAWLRRRALRAWADARRLTAAASDLATETASTRAAARATRSSAHELRRRAVATAIDRVLDETGRELVHPIEVGPVALLALVDVELIHDLRSRVRREFEWVLAARDGATAVGLAMVAQPDVAIVDHGLPLLSGFDVARGLEVYAPATGVLLMTGDADVDAAARTLGVRTIGKAARGNELAHRMELMVA